MALREYLAGEIVEDCADGRLTRREALRRLVLLGLGASAAGALLAGCGDDGGGTEDAANRSPSGTTAPSTAGGGAEAITFVGDDGVELRGAFAAPDGEPSGALLVVHENRGLTPHFVDVVARFAADGYATLCVDLLSRAGGTDSLDEGGAQAGLAAAPGAQLLGDLQAGIDELGRRAPGAAVGAVGFCFGGGMVWALLDAGEDRLAAAVPFYGPAPADPDFSGSRAAVLGIYAGRDDRVNGTRAAAEAALEAAGLTYELRTFDGVDHAFFNDTGPRYDPDAAAEAYDATLDWLGEHLA